MKFFVARLMMFTLLFLQILSPLAANGQERQVQDRITGQPDRNNDRGIDRGAEQSKAESYINPSELHYRANRPVPEVRDIPEALKPNLVEGRGGSVAERSAANLHWNTAEGRAATAALIAGGEELNFNQQPGGMTALTSATCSDPHVTDPGGNYDEVFYNQIDKISEHYRTPGAFVGNDEAKARNIVDDVKASMPMFLPYRAGNVYPYGGWYYGNGGFHAAADFLKTEYDGSDPTFAVHSVADGKVVATFWDDRTGNTVIIEHVAPNGDRYRSLYLHLRDGFDHDLAKAKAINYTGSDSRIERYKKFAHLANPSTLLWGTNAQKIKVEAGDTVYAGQQIAWSGNTGYGGAGWGLNDDGTPADPNWGNNHLHLYFAVSGAIVKSSDWVLVDPFGVYSDNNAQCYELGKDVAYVRLFAPFYSSFHNVPVDTFLKYFGYYPGMGMALQTISVHRWNNTLLASGSFQGGLSSQWYARVYLTQADFQYWFNTYDAQGYRPRELSVTIGFDGQPRFNCIWKKRGNEGYYTWINLTDAQWNQKWQDHVVQGHMRVEDYAGYEVNGVRMNAAIFVGDGSTSFAEWHYLSLGDLQTKFNNYYAQGLYLSDLTVTELGSGRSYGGVWRPQAQGAPAYVNMTPADYQAKFDQFAAQGYRLRKIQGYANSGQFAAIWMK